MEESHAFICETCHAGFRTKQALGSHRRWKHPIRAVRKILPSNPFFSFFKKKKENVEDEEENIEVIYSLVVVTGFQS